MLLFGCGVNTDSLPKLEESSINIAKVDFKRNQQILIEGKSAFYWKQFPKNNNKEFNSTLLTKVDSIQWPIALWTSLGYKSKGYGTYRFFVTQKDQEQALVLNIDKVLGAIEVWINGEMYEQLGVISKTDEGEVIDGKPLRVKLPKESNLDIMLLVSNHHHRLGGGFPFQNYIQSEHHFLTEQKTKPLIEGLVTLLIVIFGFYQIYMFFTLNKNIYFLYFGLFCIIGASRQLFVGEALIYSFFPEISFSIVQKIRYIGYLGGLIIMILYHCELFPKYLSKQFVKVLCSILLIGIVYIMFTSVYSGTLIMPFYQLYGLFTVLVGYYIIVRAIKNKEPYAKWVLVVMLMMTSLFVNDILNAMSVIQTKYMVNYGVLFYVILQVHLNHKIQTEKENKLKELFLNIESLQSSINYKQTEIEELRKETFQQIKSKEVLVDNLKKVVANDTSISIQNIIANLKSELLEDTQLLNIKNDIEVLNTEFIQRIKKIHPSLTKTDLEICSYLRMSLGRKEIARLRFTSIEAVKKSRNRLRKKMELTEEVNLEKYLQSI